MSRPPRPIDPRIVTGIVVALALGLVVALAAVWIAYHSLDHRRQACHDLGGALVRGAFTWECVARPTGSEPGA